MSELISSKIVKKTRKEHSCFGCGDTFPIGSKMACDTYKDDNDEISTLYICPHCAKHWNDPWSEDCLNCDEGIGEGELKVFCNEYFERKCEDCRKEVL